MRGVAINAGKIYIATSTRLLAFTPELKIIKSWSCPYLLDCHGIAIWDGVLYLTSAGFDSIIGFDLASERFHWAMHVQTRNYQFKADSFDPGSEEGPLAMGKLLLNNIFCNQHGMYISGLNTGGLLHFNGKTVNMAVTLPKNARDAQPFRDGVIFNDTDAGALRYTGRGEGEEDRAMRMPQIDEDQLTHSGAIRDGIAEPGFARGLCVLSDRLVAGGSSPATIAIYDLAKIRTLGTINLSRDVRESIHSIAHWPDA